MDPDQHSQSAHYQLRDASEADTEFEYRLYCSIAKQNFAGIDQTLKSQILSMQFDAREHSYGVRFPNTKRSIIIQHGRDIGRLWIAARETEVILVDIALLASECGNGVGTAVFERLKDQCISWQKPLRLHVANTNKAGLRFYLTHGCQVANADQMLTLCEFVPPLQPDISDT